MLIESLSEEAFEEMVSGMKEIGLSNDVCCNFFPERVRLTGPDADHGVIRDYLERAMGRAHRLGTKKIVFGSCPARNLPEGVSEEEGYQQLTAVLKECVIPLCAKYDILIVMEAIYSGPCNFIITLPEAMELVRRVNSPYVAMLADTMHMAYNAEDPQYLYQCYPSLNDQLRSKRRNRAGKHGQGALAVEGSAFIKTGNSKQGNLNRPVNRKLILGRKSSCLSKPQSLAAEEPQMRCICPFCWRIRNFRSWAPMI